MTMLSDSWVRHAACDVSMEDWFFPPEWLSKRSGRMAQRQAKAVCHGCPVREQCLEAEFEAMDRGAITVGVRGGLDAKERFNLFDRQHPGRAHKVR